MSSYQDYQLKDYTRAFIKHNNFQAPTPIQKAVIPPACKGRDIIGISKTGTGKTHAFLIPLLERINIESSQVQAVITAPTRELAIQLYQRCQIMNEVCPSLRIKLIIGGLEKSRMIESLKEQPHIVIGTPGRIKDLFLNDLALRVDSAKIMVVDEADMTLEFGFLKDVDAIAGRMRKDLQMMSFSATIPQELQLFLKKYMKHPEIIRIQDTDSFEPQIEHILVPCRHKSYEEALLDILPGFQPYICLIFANTRQEAAKTAQTLRDHNYGVIELHGDLTPRERNKAMKELADSRKSFVVATDIAARGIDIEGISHVVSLGFPNELDFYIHRSGRTGRAGHDGICYALYQKQDEAAIRNLKQRGIHFAHRSYKNQRWNDLKPLFESGRVRKADPLQAEIAKQVKHRKTKVKPGYKVKQKQEIEKMRRRAKRQLIQNDIRRQKKERAKQYQQAKQEGEN